MSVSDEVRVYLKNKPYMIEALKNGIVNYSSLARIIQHDTRLRQYHAIKAALRRYSLGLLEEELGMERHALSILKRSTVAIQSGITIIIADGELNIEGGSRIKLNDYFIYLVEKGTAFRKNSKSIIKMHENVSAIVIHSEQKLEAMPGFVAFIASVLAEQGINILEFVSCYTETLLIVSSGDAIKSYELLMSMM
ncbi:MAG: ACT domain-containing protein [Candidatus Micrarchaeota archaeon]|nr:ACT domain-containing protein [Candidatus Micrarchaeota archaeon]